MSGAMSDDYVIRMLRSIRCSAIEVFFHPADPQGSGYRLDPCGPNHGDLQALLSPSLKDFLETNGYSLTNYQGIASSGDRL
jgi:hypothetical protein